MIYYIVPPIVIVAGLGILVFFIFRKSDAINKQIRAEKEQGVEGGSPVIISKIHVFSLVFLEKLMLKIKLLFLKSYNKFDHWMHSVRSKKEKKQEQIETIEACPPVRPGAREAWEEAAEIAAMAEASVEIKEEKIFKPAIRPAEKTKDTPISEPKIPESLRRMVISERKEVKAAPMVSQRVVRPEIKKKQKSYLEEALIERIALNPRDIEAYERLGDYYLEQKNNEDALECFRQVLKLSPGHHKAKNKVGKLEKNILGW